jgi:hypothetical protein
MYGTCFSFALQYLNAHSIVESISSYVMLYMGINQPMQRKKKYICPIHRVINCTNFVIRRYQVEIMAENQNPRLLLFLSVYESDYANC